MNNKPTLFDREFGCQRCNGDGFYYVAPEGVNPFACRIEHLARILRKVTCAECKKPQPTTHTEAR